MSIRFATLPVLAALSLAACDGGGAPAETRVAAGEVETRSFAASDFTAVVAAGADRVIIRRGERFSVSARGRAGLLDRLTVRVDGGALRLGRESGFDWGSNEQLGTAVITVTMPRLAGITLAGSGEVQAERLDGGAAELTLAGSGDLTVSDAVVESLEVTLAGSGDIVLAGRAQRTDVTVAGSGDINGTTFGAETADVTVAGSGSVTMRVRQSAEVAVYGSGDVTLTGGAQCRITRRGSGDASCTP